MEGHDSEAIQAVRDYHRRTKHHLDRYAASLGYMDWANQPHPFRSFPGAPQTALAHPATRLQPTYDALFDTCPATAPLDAEFVARLFYHSLALSAWKEIPGAAPWSLRINPSSGALHPTEGYLISGPVAPLIGTPGVFHYNPFHHALERRCSLTDQDWRLLTQRLPAPCLLIGLSSIYWRESWKYGERAYRYCHHDVGHALGAIAFAARTLGCATRLVSGLAADDLGRLLGVHAQTGSEAEHADCLLAVYPLDSDQVSPGISMEFSHQWPADLAGAEFLGQPNQLSREHHAWPAIDQVAAAVDRQAVANSVPAPAGADRPDPLGSVLPDRGLAAEQIIRQRRSAVDMDGHSSLPLEQFWHLLHRTLPDRFPFTAAPGPPRVSLLLFVHRVTGLVPGLYLLVRDPGHEDELRRAIKRDWDWVRPDDCPGHLHLYRLRQGDVNRVAKAISCQQDIAGDGVFAVAMLGAFDAALTKYGAAYYPRLFWETGLIGQVLYLEAEAAGLRGTGIGCYFDDMVHDLLGIQDESWQSLYHFTVGGPIDDPRLQTLAPYAHLGRGM